MRLIRLLFLLVISVCLIILALANRQLVSLKLLPEGIADYLSISPSVSLPLFLVIFGGILLGLLVGFFWEYLRELKHRRALGVKTKEVKNLEREMKQLKSQNNTAEDEILALLD